MTLVFKEEVKICQVWPLSPVGTLNCMQVPPGGLGASTAPLGREGAATRQALDPGSHSALPSRAAAGLQRPPGGGRIPGACVGTGGLHQNVMHTCPLSL